MHPTVSLSAVVALCIASSGCHKTEPPPAPALAPLQATKPVAPPVAVTAVAVAAPSPSEQALAIARGWTVAKHIEHAGCFDYTPGTATADATEIEVRERHGGTCGGDPATSPVVARLRVHAGGALEVYDAPSNAWAATKIDTSLDLTVLCKEEDGDVMEAGAFLADASHPATPALRALVTGAYGHGAETVLVKMPAATGVVVLGPAADPGAIAWAKQQQSAQANVDAKGPRCAWISLK